MASPQLSKFGFGYQLASANTIVVAKHVDYNTNKWYDLKFTNPVLYFATVQNIRADVELDFNDFFLVVRNGTNTVMTDPATIAASNPVEQGWQVMGSNFTLIRQRSLALDTNVYAPSPVTRELANFLRTFVDPSVVDKLIVLNIYAKTPSTYDLVEFDYGNILSNNQVVKPLTPSYISFTQPSTTVAKTEHIYQWVYTKIVGGSDTNITVYTVDSSAASHYRIDEYTQTGLAWAIQFQNKRCKLMSQGSLSFMVKETNLVYDTTSISNALSTAGVSLSGATNWAISDDCRRFWLDTEVFYLDSNNAWAVYTRPSGLTISTVDQNVTFALGTDGSLYKILPTSIAIYFTPTTPFPAGSSMYTHSHMLGLGTTGATSAEFVGFTDDGTTLKSCINYTKTDFVSQPKIFKSPSLTKVLILGEAPKPSYMGTGNMVYTEFYLIQCPNFQNLTLPTTHFTNLANIKVNLGESFIHITKVNGAGTPTNDVVYYFKQGTVAISVFDKAITLPANTAWVRS